MKTKDWMMAGVVTFGLITGIPVQALGDENLRDQEEEVEEDEIEEEEWEDDEEREIQFPGKDQTMAFLKESLPLALELLEKVKEEEGEDEYGEVLNGMREFHHEYLEIRRHDGEEAADLFLGGMRNELAMDHLLHLYHDGDGTEAERDEIREKINDLVKEQLEREKKVVSLELEMVKEHLRELEEELENLNGLGEDEIKERVLELLEDEEDEE